MLVTGPDFVALQVADLQRAAEFYQRRLGLRRAASAHDDLAAAGVPIVAPPAESPFGPMFTFRDPDGYAITLHSRPAR